MLCTINLSDYRVNRIAADGDLLLRRWSKSFRGLALSAYLKPDLVFINEDEVTGKMEGYWFHPLQLCETIAQKELYLNTGTLILSFQDRSIMWDGKKFNA
jgi:maltoporin